MVLVGVGCGEGAPGDVRDWRPTDHNNAEASDEDPSRVPASDRPAGATDAIESVWTTQCAPCHGGSGRGDGPLSRSFQGVRDLSDPQWQGATTDADIAAVIRNGRNRMPAFGEALSDDTVNALVAHIRSLTRR